MLSEEIKITKGAAGAADGTSDVEGSPLNMAGWDGAVIMATIATANAGNFLKGQQGNNSGLSDAADLAGTKVVATANAQVVWLDIYRPSDQYLRGLIVRAGASTLTGDMYYIQYRGRKAPVVNVITDVIIGERHVSPAEGTA